MINPDKTDCLVDVQGQLCPSNRALRVPLQARNQAQRIGYAKDA